MRTLRTGSVASLLWLLLCLPTLAAEDAVHMLRAMFEKPVDGWKQHLKSHAGLLDAGFFESVGKRIRWGIENNHVDDAFRFAVVADLAAQVVGKPDNCRVALSEYLKINQSGLPEPDVYSSDPNQPSHFGSYVSPERRKFVDAQLKEALGDHEGAYASYRALAEGGYLPDQTWYRAALISEYLGEHERAQREFDLAEQKGRVEPDVYWSDPLRAPGWVSPVPLLPDSPHPGGWPASDSTPGNNTMDSIPPVPTSPAP